MSDYTPDMDAVREDWMQAAARPEGYALVNMDPPDEVELRAQFDRFIAKVKADALREAAQELLPPYNCELNFDGTEDKRTAIYVEAVGEVHAYEAILEEPYGWLRDRAKEIEGEV